MKRKSRPTIGPVEFIDGVIKRDEKGTAVYADAVALSFCVGAQSGRPPSPEELRNLPEVKVGSEFDSRLY